MERQTRQSRAVYDAISNAGRPLLPKEVLDIATRDVPGISIATIYRNLKNLNAEGRIRTVDLPGENSRYEKAGQSHHHYFQCRDCNRVFDVVKCPGDMKNFAPPGFEVDSHEIVLYGRCEDCGKT